MADRKTQSRKHAVLYIDRAGETAIVVTLHYNGDDGYLFEDATPSVIATPLSSDAVGSAVAQALDASEVRAPLSRAGGKLREWPAFKCSRRRSAKQFELDFIRLHVSGANDTNLAYLIEGWPEKDAEVRALASASSAAVSRIGEQCLAVWRACRDRAL